MWPWWPTEPSCTYTETAWKWRPALASASCLSLPRMRLTIGCKSEETGRDSSGYWQGFIDELAIFNRALPVDAIRQLYAGPKNENNAIVEK